MSRSRETSQPVDLDRLQGILDHRFGDRSLLELALTHESYSNERHLGASNNERLEFLGDAVLGLVVCQYLYEHHPGLPEGRLAQVKAHLVSTSHLAGEARGLDLGEYLLLGRGEALSQGRTRDNVLADALEAVIGALYLDGGLEVARPFVLRLLRDAMDHMEGSQKDYKSLLQEHTQRLHKSLPRYRVVGEEGPPHERTFQVEVDFLDEVLGSGSGRSKREASQKAAQQALEVLHLRAGHDLEVETGVPHGGMAPSSGEGPATGGRGEGPATGGRGEGPATGGPGEGPASGGGRPPVKAKPKGRTFEPRTPGGRRRRILSRAGHPARAARRRGRGARRRPRGAAVRAARRR